MHSIHTNSARKITVSTPKNALEDPKKCQKCQNCLEIVFINIFKAPKTQWSAVELLITPSFAKIQFAEVYLDEFSENMAFFTRCCKKSKFEEEKRVFSFKVRLSKR